METIRYESGACFGRCPIYSVAVSSDGRGVFTGQRFTAVSGAREFWVTPEQYAAFKARLAPFRPKDERLIHPGTPDCGPAASDLISVDIHWQGRGGGQHLNLYFGCSKEGNRAMTQAIGSASELLPIEQFIGARP